MAFEKVIPILNIQPQYQDFTNEFLQNLTGLLGSDLHSIYMCGSIPKGFAIPDQSDADFTLVFNRSPDNSRLMQLEILKSGLLSKYPFITKIDTPNCLVSEVLDNPYEWGFWVKIICICVYGQDLSENLPNYVPSQKLILGLNRDIESSVGRLIDEFNTTSYSVIGRILAKRVLRAMYTLTLDREESWKDNFAEIYVICKELFPKWNESLTVLFNCVSGIDVQNDHFLEHAKKLYQFVLVQSNFIIINIQQNKENIPLVSQWVFEEFFRNKIPDVNQNDIMAILNSRKIENLPMTFTANAGSECIGTISLFEFDLKGRHNYTPWLGALYVKETWRSCGAGVKLIEFIQDKAFALGFETLYLRTENTGNYYEKLRWIKVEELIDEHGQNVTIYKKSTGK